jgi:hypothetical protein
MNVNMNHAFSNLSVLLDDRLGLFLGPTAMCLVCQLSAYPHDSWIMMGLPIGQLTSVLSSTTDATRDRIRFIFSTLSSPLTNIKKSINNNNNSSSSSSSTPALEPFPSTEAWKPVLLHPLVHHDTVHLLENLVFYGLYLSAMRFPRFCCSSSEEYQRDRGGGDINNTTTENLRFGNLNLAQAAQHDWWRLRRGLFLGALMASGAIASALMMERVADYDTRKVQAKIAGGWSETAEKLVGHARERLVLQRSYLVGASGSLYTLAGWNCTYRPRITGTITSLITIAMDIFNEVSRPHDEFFQNTEKPITAYAAHIGGFLWGLSCGLIVRWMESRTDNSIGGGGGDQPPRGHRLGTQGNRPAWLNRWFDE